MKKIILSTALTLMMVLLSACGTKNNNPASSGDNVHSNVEDSADEKDSSLEYIQDRGKLIMGLDDSFPPMGFRDDNDKIVGFDVDLAKAVAKKLDLELKLQPIEWSAKEQELKTKNIDVIWNGFSVTPDRLENLTMSKPYMENSISLVVLKDSGITSQADMAGKKLAVQSGSSAEEALNFEENKSLKDSLKDIVGLSDYVTALMDLETGNSDAVLMDSVVANYMITQAGKDFVVLDDNLVAEDYAIGFRQGEVALKDAIDQALSELKEDGTVEQIASEWFGSDVTTIQ